MYGSPVSLILGFHGCDAPVGEKILSGKAELAASDNVYDWLGHGRYFWENNPNRAFEYAREIQKRPRGGKQAIREPFVLGAVIDPGHCLNLMESSALAALGKSYRLLQMLFEQQGKNLPENRPDPDTGDLLYRPLDCAVIEMLHAINATEKCPAYDTVRGIFIEGEEVYPGAGFRKKNHVQICVRNPECIKGYFRVR